VLARPRARKPSALGCARTERGRATTTGAVLAARKSSGGVLSPVSGPLAYPCPREIEACERSAVEEQEYGAAKSFRDFTWHEDRDGYIALIAIRFSPHGGTEGTRSRLVALEKGTSPVRNGARAAATVQKKSLRCSRSAS